MLAAIGASALAASARAGGLTRRLADGPAGAPAPIAVASSLRFVWPELLTAAGSPAVLASFGASRTLALQMQRGAPFELLLSADAESIDRLVDAGLVEPGEVIEYARGRLVLVVRDDADRGAGPGGPGGPIGIASLRDWLDASPAHRIAVAHPEHAPYGRAAVQVLGALSPEPLAAMQVVRGESAAQALQFFATGAADVALLPASLLHEAADELLSARGLRWRALPVDPGLHEPLRHRAAVVRGAGAAAHQLAAQLRAAAVQATLIGAGLAAVPAD